MTLMVLIIAAALTTAGPVWIGRFDGSGALPAPWRVVRLSKSVPPTLYRGTVIDGVNAIEATANSSMALLARPVTVDLGKTPALCWRWRIDAPVARADITRKSGDDYAARVYVAFDMPKSALSAGTRLRLALARRLFGSAVPDAALNYVWDNRTPVGSWRRSAYTDRAQLIVAQSGNTKARRWVTERFDVERDFARAFGGRPGRIIQIAVATDTDNTRSTARAAFANLHFVPRSLPCQA